MPTFSLSYDSTTDSNAITLTAASLATSATLVAGRESTVVSNTSNLYLDYIVSGQITTGTSPTGGEIRIYAYAPLKVASSAFTYPVATTTALTGSDAAATFEAAQVVALRLASAIAVNTTSDRAYAFLPFSIAALFGGQVPLKWGLFLTHNTGVNLNSTAGNHWFHWTGVKVSSA